MQRLAPNNASVRQSGQLIEQLSLGVSTLCEDCLVVCVRASLTICRLNRRYVR